MNVSNIFSYNTLHTLSANNSTLHQRIDDMHKDNREAQTEPADNTDYSGLMDRTHSGLADKLFAHYNAYNELKLMDVVNKKHRQQSD